MKRVTIGSDPEVLLANTAGYRLEPHDVIGSDDEDAGPDCCGCDAHENTNDGCAAYDEDDKACVACREQNGACGDSDCASYHAEDTDCSNWRECCADARARERDRNNDDLLTAQFGADGSGDVAEFRPSYDSDPVAAAGYLVSLVRSSMREVGSGVRMYAGPSPAANGTQYPCGGHIHLGGADESCVSDLDTYLAQPLAACYPAPAVVTRRARGYGAIHEVRGQGYDRIEYRTPPSWLSHPDLVEAVYCVAHYVATREDHDSTRSPACLWAPASSIYSVARLWDRAARWYGSDATRRVLGTLLESGRTLDPAVSMLAAWDYDLADCLLPAPTAPTLYPSEDDGCARLARDLSSSGLALPADLYVYGLSRDRGDLVQVTWDTGRRSYALDARTVPIVRGAPKSQPVQHAIGVPWSLRQSWNALALAGEVVRTCAESLPC